MNDILLSTEKYQCKAVELTDPQKIIDIEVTEYEEEDGFRLATEVGGKEYSFKYDSYFATYQGLRDKLLDAGYSLKCNGSRINAIQSNMMSNCAKVYLVESGRQALMKEVVLIWDYAEIDTFPYTEEQSEFAEAWEKSLRSEKTADNTLTTPIWKRKKFRVGLIIALIILAPILYFNSLSGRIVVKNPYSGVSGISNIVCSDGIRTVSLVSVPFFNTAVLYNRADYGYYTYSFDIKVDGKTYRPKVGYFKTNWWTHERFNVTVEILKNGDTYDAIVSFSKYSTKKITDIEHNEIEFGLGP